MARSRRKRLRHHIRFVEPVREQDRDGTYVDTYPDASRVGNKIPALVLPARGTEGFEGTQIDAVVRYAIRIRYRDGVRPTQHIVTHEKKVLNIESAIDMENTRKWLDIVAVEEVT